MMPITPSQQVRIWSIIHWKMSCAQARPQGRWTNLNLLGGSCLLVSLTTQFSWTIPVLMRKVGQGWLVQGCELHTIWSGDVLNTDGLWVSIQWQCLGLQIVECLIQCMPSVWCHWMESIWACHPLVICLGNNLAKTWSGHDITTCSSVNFASEASTLIWSCFSRHGDSCPSFSECINGDCSDVDVFLLSRGWGRAYW